MENETITEDVVEEIIKESTKQNNALNDELSSTFPKGKLNSKLNDMLNKLKENEFVNDEIIVEEDDQSKENESVSNSVVGNDNVDKIEKPVGPAHARHGAQTRKPMKSTKDRSMLDGILPESEINADMMKKTITNGKLNEVINKLKEDKSLVPNTMKMVKENPQIKRNAENMARQITSEGGGTMGGDVPLSVRKKMAKQQEMFKRMAKQTHVQGDVTCIYMLLNGKLNTYQFDLEKVKDGDKWKLEKTYIGGWPFIVVCDSTIITGKNKRASKLIDKTVFGPVIFVFMNENLKPTNISLDGFKDLLSDD